MVGVARGHQRADTLKTYSQKTSQSNHTRTTALSNSMKLSHADWATQGGWVMVERSDQNVVHWRREWQTTSVFLPWEPHEQMKRQNDRILKEELPRWVGPNMLLEISREITPERMKGWSQSKNNTKLWMWLVIEARSDAVKSNIASEPGMSGPWIKANWKWSNKRWQQWMSTFYESAN